MTTTFSKSKKRAVGLGSLVLLTYSLTLALTQLITSGTSGELFIEPLSNLQWWHVVILGAIIAGIIALGGGFIYLFNESHFGKTAAVRWAIFGIVLALLFELLKPWNSSAFFLNELIDLAKGALQLGLAYLIAFRLFPMKQPTPSQHP
ncbi:hypothetical protein TFLX_00782 [Thermoflexales bacterium]|nr:hypothetical protein TFLX_00782 [Thermoflexales bacterium]